MFETIRRYCPPHSLPERDVDRIEKRAKSWKKMSFLLINLRRAPSEPGLFLSLRQSTQIQPMSLVEAYLYGNPLFRRSGTRCGRCHFGFLLFHPHNPTPNIPISETPLSLPFLPDLVEQVTRGLSRGSGFCGVRMTNPSQRHHNFRQQSARFQASIEFEQDRDRFLSNQPSPSSYLCVACF